MLMGTSVSAYEQPALAAAGGVCSDKTMDYSPMAQPCANDFAKSGMWAKDTTVSRMEVRLFFRVSPIISPVPNPAPSLLSNLEDPHRAQQRSTAQNN